ncbi:SsrA-binding protein SmpB [Candidatus Parcubacteria bacterium]|nr:MAG: SsrA-binding protein SmpB [Candidatus Parcubacteria bacterium]
MELAVNRSARFEYETLESTEAGIQLTGGEVKSIRAGHMSLQGAFIIMRGGEAWLVNANVPPYQGINTRGDYDPTRPRKLLLHRRELETLAGASAQKGLTLVPIRVYTRGARIKMEFALARRKKKGDKRAAIREREDKKTIERALRRSDA